MNLSPHTGWQFARCACMAQAGHVKYADVCLTSRLGQWVLHVPWTILEKRKNGIKLIKKMIKLFDIQDNVVLPSAHCYMIPEFKAVIDKYKEKSAKVFAYLFYTTHMGSDNPYFNYEEDERDEIVRKDLNFNIREDDVILNAKKKMEKMYETPTVRFYKAAKKSLDNLSHFLEKNSSIVGGREGNLDDVMKIMKDYDKMRQSFKNVTNDLREEQETKTRGDIELAYDQE